MASNTRIPGGIIRSGSIPTTALGGGVVTSSAQIIAALPEGTLSSSIQIVGVLPADVVSSSQQVTAFLPVGTVSSSTQLPSGIASSSAQIKDYLPTDTVSSSLQVTAFLPTGTVSSSGQVSYLGLSNIPSGIASSSGQIKDYLPTDTISSSAQVKAFLPEGSVSSSGQVDFNTISNKPALVSGSSQIDVRNTTGIATIATTGSNTFTGMQTVSDTTNSTSYLDGAVHVAGGMSVRKDVRVSGSMTVNGLLTAVSMSTQYVTSSQYIVGDNKIILNNDDVTRFGGMSIIDSGSASPTTASIYWDSLKHKFIYENLSGAPYNSGMFIAGPRNYGTLGDEVGLTDHRVPVAHGDDHIDSRIESSSIRIDFPSRLTHIENGLVITGSTEIPLKINTNDLIVSGGKVSVGASPNSLVKLRILGNTDFASTDSRTGDLFIEGTPKISSTGAIGGSLVFSRPIGTRRGAAIVSVQPSTGDADHVGLAFYTHPSGNSTDELSEVVRFSYNGNIGVGTTSPSYKLDVSGSTNIFSGYTYKIDGTDVLSATTLGSNVAASSLTSVGTLSSLTVSGDLTVDTTTLKVDSGNNRVGIGMTNPMYPLEVRGPATVGVAAPVATVTIPDTNGNRGGFGVGNASGGTLAGIAVQQIAGGDYPNAIGRLDVWVQNGAGATTAATFDASGNLGLGTIPVAWHASHPALQFKYNTAISSYSSTDGLTLTSNGYADTATTWKYLETFPSAQYIVGDGKHIWKIAPSGTSGSAITWTQAMTLNASGNLGLGVTPPSAWGSGYKVLNMPWAVFASENGQHGQTIVGLNAYNSGTVSSPAWTYMNTARASMYLQDVVAGWHAWYTAPSGTAGNAITFTQAMTLDASGNLGLGVTSSAWYSAWTGFELGAIGSTISGYKATGSVAPILQMANNYYVNSAGNDVYARANLHAMQYLQYLGVHTWKTGPNTGAAGSTITWNAGMTLDSSGSLSIGSTTTLERLRVKAANTTGSGAYAYINCTNEVDSDLQVYVTGTASTDKRAIIGPSTSTSLVLNTGGSERMRITSGGHVGIKITPTGSWGSSMAALQIGTGGVINNWTGANANMGVGVNYYDNGAGSQLRLYEAGASNLIFNENVLTFSNAVSSTAGSTITFVERMRIDSSGSVGIGTNSVTYGRVHIQAPSISASVISTGWPSYTAETAVQSKTVLHLDTAGNGSVASAGQGASAVIQLGSYYDSRGIITMAAAGSDSPSDGGRGYGRDLMVKAGNSDNGNGLVGGRLFLAGGSGYSGGVFNANYGPVIIQQNFGSVGIGITNPSTKLQVNGNVRIGSTAVNVDDNQEYAITTGGQLVIRANDGATSDTSFWGLGLYAGSGSWTNGITVGSNSTNTAQQYIALTTANVERMRINNAGNVGIGTSTPLGVDTGRTTVTINGTGSALLNHGVNGTETFSIFTGVDSTILGTVTNIPMAFNTNNTERWRITSAGIFQSSGSQTVQTSTGNLTLATAAGNGHIILSPHGTGNVGISTTGPVAKLDVAYSGVSGTPTAVFGATDGGSTRTNSTDKVFRIGGYHYTNTEKAFGIMVGSSTSTLNYLALGGGSSYMNAATLIQFYTAANTTTTTGTERARITSEGYFKASNTGTYDGSTGSYHELQQSVANVPAVTIRSTGGSYANDIVNIKGDRAASTAYNFIYATANSVAQFQVRGDGVIYAQNTTVQSISDARLKENISDATDGLAVISALRPVRYDWKAGYGNDRKNQLGFIAQEVEAVFPEAVSEWAMDEPTGEVDEDGKPITEKIDYKTVGPGALIPVLVKAIQEQQQMITTLKAQNTALETRITQLENL